jgi:ABC-type glutathione transport system ATPase component
VEGRKLRNMFGSSETEATEQQASEKAQGQVSRDAAVTATSTEAPSAAPARKAKTLEAQSVNLYYGDFHAVEDVTMRIEPNKVTALIGSSGCGKTTFLRSLNRMHELTLGASVKGEI